MSRGEGVSDGGDGNVGSFGVPFSLSFTLIAAHFTLVTELPFAINNADEDEDGVVRRTRERTNGRNNTNWKRKLERPKLLGPLVQSHIHIFTFRRHCHQPASTNQHQPTSQAVSLSPNKSDPRKSNAKSKLVTRRSESGRRHSLALLLSF